MPWIRRTLRGNTVYARADDAGEPLLGEDGRVEVVYQLKAGAKAYRANPKNLAVGAGGSGELIEAEIEVSSADASKEKGGSGGKAKSSSGKSKKGGSSALPKPPKDAIVIYTDGACSGNPGPAGIGVVIMNDGARTEISEYLGQATNNIAELTAIERALEEIPEREREREVWLHSDSTYAIGLLDKGWKAKANVELVARIRDLVGDFPRLTFVKVKGHAGVPENERCDELAVAAVERAR